ncbi:S1 family peptidase [Amycolatopsis sp. NPDC059027]|uniref:S1 family peptidase n=1 Tax=unclassified Amycolatopsis TaxID=2618356 RepID=UPI003672ED16
MRAPIRRPLIALVTTVITALVVVAPATAAVASPESENIIGGEQAAKSYTFMGAMARRSDQLYLCGAILIHERWALTAKHCLTRESPSDVELRFGSKNRTRRGEPVDPRRFVLHPRLDVALMELDDPISKRPMTTFRLLGDSTDVRVLGWGRKCDWQCLQPIPKMLRYLDTKVSSFDHCAGSGMNSTDAFCVRQPQLDAGACSGDSGGPVIRFHDGKVSGLYGVMSYAQVVYCVPSPVVVVRAAPLVTWIRQQAGDSVADRITVV